MTTVIVMLCVPSAASAAVLHGPALLPAASIFSTIGHALLGAFSWTFGLAEKFLLTTLGALVRLLIPRSWVHEGAQIMGWIVAVPNYAGQIATPGGSRHYGFAGINDLRELFMWLGIALAPLTLTLATARALIDDSEPVGIPILRVIATAAAILLYPYLWTQAANLSDQVTHLTLSLPAVTDGLQKLMEYAVGGVALGGWQLIDLGLMGAIGAALLGLIFMKVVLILVGALLYTTGPLMIGLVATRFGHAVARAWLSAVMFLLGIGIVWATIFAVGAVLIDDAGTAGPLIAGHSAFGSLVGGLILAAAGLVSLWLCLRIAREAGGLLRIQLGGMLALGAGGLSRAPSAAASSRPQTSGASLRQFGSRLSAGAGAAGGELSGAIPGGEPMRRAMRGAAIAGRRGLAGSAAVGARGVARQAAGPTAAILGHSRAGAVAVRMARSGTAAYRDLPAHPAPRSTAPANRGSQRPVGRGGSRSRRGSAAAATAAASAPGRINQPQPPARERSRPAVANPTAARGANRASVGGAVATGSRSNTSGGLVTTSSPARRSSSTRAVISAPRASRPAERGAPGRLPAPPSPPLAGRDQLATPRSQRVSATPPPKASHQAPASPPASRRSSTPTPKPARTPAPGPDQRPTEGSRR